VAIYPYLTLVFDDIQKRERALALLDGLGASECVLYGAAITDYEYLKNVVPTKKCPTAGRLAKRQLTLSTSAFLKREDMDIIIATLKKL